MSKKLYKVIYNGGRCNGAERYFKTLACAIRSAKSYLRSNSDLPEYVYCEVLLLLYSDSRLISMKGIKEFD